MLRVVGGVSWPIPQLEYLPARFAAPWLALGVTMAVIGLLAGSGPSLSTAVESIRLRPSAGVTATLEVDLDRASRATDDGYLEGFIKALDATR